MQILVVEDERRMADLLERTLHEEGHQVVVAHDGREGFEIARDSPFDVIVLDVMLPGMDGMAVARQTARVPESDAGADADRARRSGGYRDGLDSGADDYLTKPFSIDVLLARLRAVSRRGAIARPTCAGDRRREARPGQPARHARRTTC